jgi:O-antigen ligase
VKGHHGNSDRYFPSPRRNESMIAHLTNTPRPKAAILFCCGLTLVLLSLWLPFIPNWLTFVHMWRVELFASVFLLITLVFVLYRSGRFEISSPLSTEEYKFIVAPILMFIAWSALSAVWANSWKSAIHHALVWSEYLVFYCIVRDSLERDGGYRRLMYVFVGTLLMYALPAVAGYVAVVTVGGGNTLGIRFARFGEQVFTIIPLLLVGVARLRGRKFVVGTVSAAALWLLIFCSLGRANYILFGCGFAATGVLIFSVRRYRRYHKRFLVTAAALAAATVIASSLPLIAPQVEQTSVNRFRDEEGLSASNDFRKLMISLSTEMFAAHPIVGVGADNFGFEVNKYREAHAARFSDDPHLAQAENEIPERAHNEYLQIAAELGIVGLAIFAWFLTGIGLMVYRALPGLGKLPPHAHAAVIGVGLFLAGSLVTSYSFRLIQNGFVFFFVLAVAAKFLFRNRDAHKSAPAMLPVVNFRLATVGGIVACLLLAVYCTVRVSSMIVTERANYTTDITEASELYWLAMRLDDENPFARNNFGMRLFNERHYAEAVPLLNEAVDMGVATSTDFSYLASAQSLGADNIGALATMKRATLYYPRSVFALTRYGVLLKENGEQNEADKVLTAARQINPKSANTWLSVITEGPKVASERAVKEKEFAAVMDLQPQRSIYAAVTERLIRFPEEQKFSLLSVGPPKKDSVMQ